MSLWSLSWRQGIFSEHCPEVMMSHSLQTTPSQAFANTMLTTLTAGEFCLPSPTHKAFTSAKITSSISSLLRGK